VNGEDYSGESLFGKIASLFVITPKLTARKLDAKGTTQTCLFGLCVISGPASTASKIMALVFAGAGGGGAIPAKAVGSTISSGVSVISGVLNSGAGQRASERAATYSSKIVDEIGGYTYSGNAYKIGSDARSYQDSYQLIREIVSRAPNIESYKEHLLSWRVDGMLNGSMGVYELTIDPATKEVTHFMFRGLSY
jgi:hypothetical protein